MFISPGKYGDSLTHDERRFEAKKLNQLLKEPQRRRELLSPLPESLGDGNSRHGFFNWGFELFNHEIWGF